MLVRPNLLCMEKKLFRFQTADEFYFRKHHRFLSYVEPKNQNQNRNFNKKDGKKLFSLWTCEVISALIWQ